MKKRTDISSRKLQKIPKKSRPKSNDQWKSLVYYVVLKFQGWYSLMVKRLVYWNYEAETQIKYLQYRYAAKNGL